MRLGAKYCRKCDAERSQAMRKAKLAYPRVRQGTKATLLIDGKVAVIDAIIDVRFPIVPRVSFVPLDDDDPRKRVWNKESLDR